MSLEKQKEKTITSQDFHAIYRSEHGGAGLDSPAKNVQHTQYECSSKRFLDANTYPVWFTDSDRQGFVDYNDPRATPILFRELMTIDHLRDEKLAERKRIRPSPHVVVQHCKDCDVRVIADGCKGLLNLAHQGADVTLAVTEISGEDWSAAHFDMRNVCCCSDTRSSIVLKAMTKELKTK